MYFPCQPILTEIILSIILEITPPQNNYVVINQLLFYSTLIQKALNDEIANTLLRKINMK